MESDAMGFKPLAHWEAQCKTSCKKKKKKPPISWEKETRVVIRKKQRQKETNGESFPSVLKPSLS